MSEDIGSEIDGAKPPRETAVLFGHSEAEQTLLDSYRTGRMHHAWLLGGAAGIGKATLAYRLARFILAHPDPAQSAVREARSLAVPFDHPVARRIAAQAHPDLLIIQRTENDSGNLRAVITVDEARRTTTFFGSTAGEGGWRVCIVDTADDLQQPHAVNALLKVVEEPPRRALFLLLSNAPGRLLPTIRSRCRRLLMRPLTDDDVRRAVAAATDVGLGDANLREAAAAAKGSAGRALDLLDTGQLRLRSTIGEALAALPNADPRRLHALGERMQGNDPAPLRTFVDAVTDWMSARLEMPGSDTERLARVGMAWEKVTTAARETEIYNLDRKSLVFNVFGVLSEVVRQ